jgi:quercetin dioxygenase-like cupin family protein
MRMFLVGTAFLAASTTLDLENARVRVFRADSALAVDDHPAAVIVLLEGDASHKAGDAYWSGDPAIRRDIAGSAIRSLIIVEPKDAVSPPAVSSTPSKVPDEGTRPGQSPFIGMSFQQLFENDRVSVIRGRMEVGAQEGFHTHASDIVLVHLSGGAIENTADGQTKVNHWKHGDVEFEARGSSHSARNLGPAVEAVLVTLKP